MTRETEEAAGAAVTELTVSIGAGRGAGKILDREDCDA